MEGFAHSGDSLRCQAPKQRRDHIAMPITESDNLVAFHLLVSAEPMLSPPFFAGSRTVAVDDVV